MTLLSGLVVAGCGSSLKHRQDETAVIKKGKGPPAHAPAHGYRHKHHRDDVELIYDSGPGVYVVVGFPGHYYLDGRYFRQDKDVWQLSTSIDGDWKMTDVKRVPPGVLKAAGDRGRGKHGKK
jgi:hypothetical protein